MFTYRKATEADRNSYIDFANMVFSMAHRPHDFKALSPKVYGDGKETADMHYLALDANGGVRGLVGVMPGEMIVEGVRIRTGYVGTVSVHPYARGEGHMKKLMQMATDEMREEGCDLSMLGGQRQRYEYFGYSKGGIGISYTVTATNVRHALRDVDADCIELREIKPGETDVLAKAHALHEQKLVRGLRTPDNFYEVATTWTAKLLGAFKSGELIGYMIVGGDNTSISEFVLVDYTLTGAVVKKFIEEKGVSRCEFACADYHIALRRELARFAEYSTVGEPQQLLVFRFAKVLGAFLKLKASYARIEDGVRSYIIDGQPVTIKVRMNEVTVTEEAEEDAVPLTAMDAQFLFFGRDGLLYGEPLPMGWAPLPLYLESADCF